MNKRLAFLLLGVGSMATALGQPDFEFDCQPEGLCATAVDYAFELDGGEQDQLTFAFDGTVTGGGVVLNWAGGGTSYPSDLSLSLCAPNGDCIMVPGYGGSLDGTSIGGWPANWNNTLAGENVACFAFDDLALGGDGLWTLTGLNTFSGSADGVSFSGSIHLFALCPEPLCEDVEACNFGDPAPCVPQGCTNETACNYDAQAGCDDGSCAYEEHIFVPNTETFYGSEVFYWCGPLPDCSSPIVGCPIPSGYIELEHPCLDLILANMSSCATSWTETCALEFLLCMQYTLGCTNEAACNYDPDAGYDDGTCVFPGAPCDDGDDCTANDSLTLECECEGQRLDLDGDGLCGDDDCDDTNPGIPDAFGRCDIPVAGCSNEAALNFTPDPGEETACVLPGPCGEPLIAAGWASGFTGWMSPENWTYSHPEKVSINAQALVLQGLNAGETDTVKAMVTAPAGLILQFSFAYHSEDGSPVWDPPMVLINGEIKPIMAYMTSTVEPGFPIANPEGWFHDQSVMPSPDVAPDPFLLPPEHLLPSGLLMDDAATWDYPYQMPIGLQLDSGDVLTLGLATMDGEYGAAALAIAAMSRKQYCPGCSDESACNFDTLATHVDGSCDYSCIGCMEELACDYDPDATLPADSCDYSCYGCTHEDACNFDPEATLDDESCDFCSCGFPPKVVATGGLNQEGFNFTNATLLATDGGLAQCALMDTEILFFGVEEGPFIDIDGASDHVLALTVDSMLYGYGRDNFGQISVPADLPHPIAFSAGHTHSVAVDREGQPHGWGDSNQGQLDWPETSGLAGIEAGLYHTMAWDESGTVTLAAGNNDYGQLDVPDGLLVQEMASSLHNVVLTTEGEVVCWGYNEYGQCNVPAFDQPVVAIAASKRSSLALLEDGSLEVWGRLDHIEPIEGAVAISGNISEDYFTVMNHHGRVHHLMNFWFMSIQGPSAVALAEARPNCTEWCLDIDGDDACDLYDDCIGTEGECGCECLHDENENGICDEKETEGCMDPDALNFNPHATLARPCLQVGASALGVGLPGQDACNFDSLLVPGAPPMVTENLSYAACGGCTDPFGCNYNPDATWEDGTCEYASCTGCPDPFACNFNPLVQGTDSCDYCSCHWTTPMLDGAFFSNLTINSQGEASLRSSMNINVPRAYGPDIHGVLKKNGVRSGSAGGYSAMLIMRDSSLQVLNDGDEENRMRRLYREEFDREHELGGVDLHLQEIEEETALPGGQDFVKVETDGLASIALRADGTVEVWGSEALLFGDWAINGQGENGVNILEWASSLGNIVDVEMSSLLQGVLALDANGTLHAYSSRRLYSGIPAGFNENISLMSCGFMGRCIVLRDDGEIGYLFMEAELSPDAPPNALSSSLQGLDQLIALGTPVEMNFDGIVSSVLYDNGNIGFASGVETGSWHTIVDASEVPGAVSVSQGGVFGVVLDNSGQATRYDMDTTAVQFVPAYPVTPDNAVPALDGFTEQYPRRALLGPPTDCQGCPDSDGDGICDVVDDHEGEEDPCGCTYAEAENYSVEASCDDGTCVFSVPETSCETDINGNGTTDTPDLLLLLSQFSLPCQ